MSDGHMDKLAAVGEPKPETETLESLREKYDQARLSQKGVDKANQALQARVKELEGTLASHKSEAELMARVARAEEGFKAKERRLELDFYARQKALASGVDIALLEGFDFKDELQVEKKIGQLSESVKALADAQVNARLMDTQKPMAGQEISKAMSGRGEPDQLAARIAKELRGVH